MKLLVSIVSHRNQEDIAASGLVDSLAGLQIILRENVSNSSTRQWRSVLFVQNLRACGFGRNHNKNFEIANLNPGDWFVVCNPDIIVDVGAVEHLIRLARGDGARIAAPYLWNSSAQQSDHNVRPKITPISLTLSFLGFKKVGRYSKRQLEELRSVHWASGAFLAIEASLFRDLRGFDESYFMYMEDVDICDRARKIGERVWFYKEVEIVHNAARANRSFLSKSFFSHLGSAIRYFFRYYFRLTII
jgi:N-acetylglucosaminyl-diphospho-decaprenol L-rhamnosyltransferase